MSTIVLSCITSIFAQDRLSYDAAVLLYKDSVKVASEAVDYNYRLANHLQVHGYNRYATKEIAKGIKVAIQHEDFAREAEGYCMISRFKHTFGEKDSAYYYLNKAYPVIKTHQLIDERIRSHLLLVDFNLAVDNLAPCLHNIRKAEELLPNARKSRHYFDVYLKGAIMGSVFRIDSIETKFMQKLEFMAAKDELSNLNKMLVYERALNYYFKRDSIKQGTLAAQSMRHLVQLEPHLVTMSGFRNSIANYYYEAGKPDSSLFHLEAMVNDPNEASSNKLSAIGNILMISVELKDKYRVEKYCAEAIKRGIKQGNHRMILQAANAGLEFYSSSGQTDSILKLNKVIQVSTDSIMERNKVAQTNFVDYSSELSDLNQAYDQLEDEKLEVAEQLEESNNYLVITLIIVLALALLAVILGKQKQKEKKLNKELIVRNMELIKQNQIPIVKEDIADNVNKAKIPVEKSQEILEKLTTFFSIEDNYKRKDLKLAQIAVELDTNSNYVSQVIREEYHSNFNDYVNSHRVSAAMKLLLSSDFDRFKVETVGFEVGFNAKSSFFAIFKKHTGLTPTQFKKQGLSELKARGESIG